jgi:hypothetical protein
MFRLKAIRSTRRQALGRAFLIGVAGVLAPVFAYAHFILVTPDSWMSQDIFGFPEKLGPCGDEGGGTPTSKVTAFHPGQTISVTISEVIMHPGHYRVALAVNDRSELPAEPTVTPVGDDPCGSAAVQDPPTFPVLADNVLPHTQAFAGPQTFTVTLPTGVTCNKCTLQVLEYMSSHPAPCFYHHCADISIQEESVSTTSTTLITVPTSSTTTSTTTTSTTTPPCSTPRCFVEAVVLGPACGSDTIPTAIQRKLDRAPELLEQAETSPSGKARVLRKKAKRFFKLAGGSALRASRGNKPKLSGGCAALLKKTTDQLAGGL